MAGDKAQEGFRGRSFLHHTIHSAIAALCQGSRLHSAGAAALPKQRRCTSDFTWEEQLVIKNNNLEVFELYFPWLPHAQHLNSADKSCAFGFNILIHFYYRAGWSLQPGFVGGIEDLLHAWPRTVHSSLPVTALRGNNVWLYCQKIVLKIILTSDSSFDPRGSSKTDIRGKYFVGYIFWSISWIYIYIFFCPKGLKLAETPGFTQKLAQWQNGFHVSECRSPL